VKAEVGAALWKSTKANVAGEGRGANVNRALADSTSAAGRTRSGPIISVAKTDRRRRSRSVIPDTGLVEDFRRADGSSKMFGNEGLPRTIRDISKSKRGARDAAHVRD